MTLQELVPITLGNQIAPRRERMEPNEWPDAPYLSLEHIEAHTTRIMDLGRAGDMKSTCFVYRSGDVLYSRLRPYLNKVAVAREDGLCSGEFIVFPGDELGDSRYLKYRLNAPDFLRFTATLDAGDRPRVKWSQISEFETTIPSGEVQTRVADYFDAQFSRLADAEANLKRAKQNLERYRRSVLHAACTGKLVPTEAELARAEGRDYEPAEKLLERILVERRKKWEEAEIEKAKAKGKELTGDAWKKYKEPVAPVVEGLPELPEGWCWVSVEQLGDAATQPVMTGPFGSSVGSKDFVDSGVPLLTIGCLREEGISLDAAKYVTEGKARELSRYKLEEGDFLFSRMASVGRAGVVTAEIAGARFNYHIMRLRFTEGAISPGYYLAYIRGSPIVPSYVRQVNHGATRDGINTEQLLGLPIALPPGSEQRRICMRLDQVLSHIRASLHSVERNGGLLEKVRQSLLQSVFSPEAVHE